MNWIYRSADMAATGPDTGIYVRPATDRGFMLIDNRGIKPKARGPFASARAAMDAAEQLPAMVS